MNPLNVNLLKYNRFCLNSRFSFLGVQGEKNFAKQAARKDDSVCPGDAPPPAQAIKKPRPKKFRVYRYNPDDKSRRPEMKEYTIDLNNCRPMVLDALDKIKLEQDTTLTFRKSCREGVCGSCGMNIDGKNGLACRQRINPKGVTKIYPLPHMYVLKDLVVDFRQFFKQHKRIKPYLIRKNLDCVGEEMILQSVNDRNKLDGYVECILCACCSTACPEYWWHGHAKAKRDFLGPASLLAAARWLRDSRDEGKEERLNDLRDYYSVYRCHQINNCTSVCPKRLNPGKAISELRLLLSGLKKKSKPDMCEMVPAEPTKACPKKSEEDTQIC